MTVTARRRLLRLAARRPFVALAVIAAAIATVLLLVSPRGGFDSDAGNPRLVLGRVWFDELPEKRTDEVHVWIWLAGGIGLYDFGSAWRSSSDIFEFERQGDRLTGKFLQDGKRFDTKFSVTKCDDAPPFDLCLTLEDTPRGPKRYFGFGRDDDLAAKVPWGPAMMRAAQSRAAMK